MNCISSVPSCITPSSSSSISRRFSELIPSPPHHPQGLRLGHHSRRGSRRRHGYRHLPPTSTGLPRERSAGGGTNSGGCPALSAYRTSHTVPDLSRGGVWSPDG